MSGPKIVILLDEMGIGGIPVACLSFLENLKDKAEVTMILEKDTGVFTDKIPEGVRVIVKPSEGIKEAIARLVKRKKYVSAALSAVKYKLYSLTGRWIRASAVANCAKGVLLDEEFDMAIAYHGMSASQMNRTLYQIKAKKKITWIQGDHSFVEKDKRDALWVYKQFDHIFCVSESTKKRFLSDFPTVGDMTSVYYMHLLVADIVAKADAEQVSFADGYTSIVTVGRVSSEKGQDLIPNAAKLLLERGYKIRWYIVGDGDDRARIEGLIDEAGVRDAVIMLGNKTNPYPYIKACDVYVQPSYTEGYGLTIFEAAILGRSIVATGVGGATEKLCDGEEAIFVSADAKSIADGIERLLTDEDLGAKLKENIAKRDFSNKEEIAKILDII